jgi:hypothetical protein
MIDLQELVYALNEYIGRDKFAMFFGTNGAPNSDDERIVCTANIGQIPYAFSDDEIDATSLNITFTFDLPCGTVEDDSKRDNAVYTLTEKLLTWKKILIQYPDGKKYVLNTFFEMLPMGQPYVDSGKITQQLVIAGNALLQNLECGAIVGNNEETYINGERVLVVDKVSSTNITHESNMPLSQELYLPELEAIAYSNTIVMTCLYMGKAIDRLLWAVGEGLYNPNTPYRIKTILKNSKQDVVYEREREVKLLSVKNITSTGVFLRYEATFQLV